MPTSPNDPDYNEVFAKYRERIQKQKEEVPKYGQKPRVSEARLRLTK
jgi:hypothetical protein